MVNFCVKKNTNYTLTVSKASYITHTETINVSSDTVKNITLQPEFTPTTTRFDYTGAVQTYTVPTGTTKLIVDCVGAAGGRAMSASSAYTDRAKGGRVQCKLTVSAGQTINIYVGGVGGDGYYVTSTSTGIKQASGGWNGGGNADSFGYTSYYNTKNIESGSAGGGASDIRIGGTALSNRKIVAGAGGGTCYVDYVDYYTTLTYTLIGGAGGGTTGGTGEVYSSYSAGQGGTQSAGGAHGTDNVDVSTAAGSLGQGGNGHNSNGGSCGGGAGYYGGGAGGSGWSGAGGGGSSYTDSSLCSEVTHTQGYSSATGNGWIIITTSNE